MGGARLGYFLSFVFVALLMNVTFVPEASAQPTCDPALGPANPVDCIPPVDGGGDTDPVDNTDGGSTEPPVCDPALGSANPGNCTPPVDGDGSDGGDTDPPVCDPALGTANPGNCIPPVDGGGGDGGDTDPPVCDPALGSANPSNCIPPVDGGGGDGGDTDPPVCDPALGTANPGNCIPPVDGGGGDGGDTDPPVCDPALGTANPSNCTPPVDGGGDGGDTDPPVCIPALGAANPGNCIPPVNPGGDGGTTLPTCTADMLTNGVPCVPLGTVGEPGSCDPGDGSYIPAIGDDPADFPLCHLPPDAAHIGNFGAADIGSLEPGSFAGFTGEHINNLDPTAIAGITPDQLGNLDPTAIANFTPDQVTNFSPVALSGLTPDQIANLDPSVMTGFTPQQMANFDPTTVASLNPTQFENLDPSALGGLTRDNLVGLNSEVIQSMNAQQIQSLNPTEIQNMTGNGAPKLLTNISDPTLTPDDVAGLLPSGWEIDTETGAMKAPPGANLAFRSLQDDGNTDGTTLPELPDFSGSLALGGAAGEKNVLMGMDGALGAANLSQYGFQQAPDGVLNIVDSGGQGSLAAFIPDTSNMVQAPEGFVPGLGQDDRGAFVLTTDDGYQIPLLPSPKDPDGLVTAIPGSAVQVGSKGETTIRQTDGEISSQIVGIFDHMLGSSDQPPGLYRTGSGINEEALVVYEDGTAQRLLPMIQSPDEFLEAAGSLEGVDAITFKTNGNIALQYQGQSLLLKPSFDVTPGTLTVRPSVVIEDGRYFFINSKGDKQEFLPVE